MKAALEEADFAARRTTQPVVHADQRRFEVAGAPAAELAGVRRSYGRIRALDGVDLVLRRGELLALLGHNGAGKSTAIGVLLGLQQPDSGSARVFGRSPRDLSVRRRLGMMMQDVELVRVLRVRELLRLTASYYPDPLPIAQTLSMTLLAPIADRKYGTLSGGQKRLVQFALAICGRPEVLLLDEPTVGLDLQARETLWSIVRSLVRGGCAVLLTTHHLEEAEALADRVTVLNRGRVIAVGPIDEIRACTAQRRVSCVTALTAEEITRWPGVETARVESGTMHVATKSPESFAARLLESDPGVRQLEIRRAGLAEAFAHLTRDAETEAGR
jgi:ABC-2 type transport system ATP-binding protein